MASSYQGLVFDMDGTLTVPTLDFAGMTPEAPLYIYAPLAIGLFALALFTRQGQLTKR